MLQQPGVAPKIVGRADPHRHAAIVPEHLLVPDVGFWVLKDLKASRTVNLCWCMCFVGGVGLKLSSCFWMVWYWFGVWLCSRLNRDCFAHIPYRLSHFEHVGGLPCVCVWNGHAAAFMTSTFIGKHAIYVWQQDAPRDCSRWSPDDPQQLDIVGPCWNISGSTII
jgi:hypothetical protein